MSENDDLRELLRWAMENGDFEPDGDHWLCGYTVAFRIPDPPHPKLLKAVIEDGNS